VIGDDDGVVVIPSQELSGLRERCRLRLEKEATIIKKVSKGESTIDLLGLNVSVINGYGVAADRARGAS
jgi:regulator of RNase E activity RraA